MSFDWGFGTDPGSSYDPGFSDPYATTSTGVTGSTGSGFDLGGSIAQILNTGVGAYGAVKLTDARANMLQQYDPLSGARYIQGQPISTLRNGAMVISPVLLLMIGAVVIFAMKE